MKATAPTLSEHLLLEAKRFRGYPGLVGHGRLNRAVTALWDEKALPSNARNLEWIMPKGQVFQATPSLLNEYDSKRLLAEVPGIVTRASALRPLESGKTVPRQVNTYHEQATRSFVAGLWDGAVALSRACLEEALEDRIGGYLGHQGGAHPIGRQVLLRTDTRARLHWQNHQSIRGSDEHGGLRRLQEGRRRVRA